MTCKLLKGGILLFLLPALWIKSVDWYVNLSTLRYFNKSDRSKNISSYFTLIGSRTVNFDEDYKVYLTRRHDISSAPSNLELEIEGKISGDTIEHLIPLDFEEKFVAFKVSE